MLISCWAAKGGSGTTVVAAALASLLSRERGGAVVADLAGDVPAVLGVPEPTGPGLVDWLAAGDAVPVDALTRIEIDAGADIRLLHRGAGDLVDGGRASVLAGILASDHRPAVADCGTLASEAARVLAAEATVSLLVTRPCYLSLRRAASAPVQPSAVVLVDEPGRSLGVEDVEAVVGAPVRAVVPVEPRIVRAVDAGLLATRLPGRLERVLRHAA